MRIYNTLSKSVEEFEPINPPNVGIYSCGPTVYDYQHIGHMRRYVGDDILIRVLKFNDYNVHHVMNITDVGHLVSDSDSGEDKMEKGARKFGLSVWDIAKKFEAQFKDSCELLNIELPKDLMHATDNISEQIELVRKLEEKGFTYKTLDGIYFDTSKFPDYFKLSRQNPDELKAGVRVEMGEKKNVSDFALWKLSPKDEKRQMEWESPWGVGFPGWHIECSAMSMKAIGNRLDIHTGGVDHINIHHTNEIAQSQCATNEKPFSKYWIHHAFLMVEGEKMSKSLENIYTVEEVVKRGFGPIALRYLYLQTHYRQEMNFTWEALEGAQTALGKLRNKYLNMNDGEINIPGEFVDAVNDDLNLPKALSVVWENIDDLNKSSLEKIDEILGLQLSSFKQENLDIPDEISKLISTREEYRKSGNYTQADKVRSEIEAKGYLLEDSSNGSKVKKKP